MFTLNIVVSISGRSRMKNQTLKHTQHSSELQKMLYTNWSNSDDRAKVTRNLVLLELFLFKNLLKQQQWNLH